MFNPLGITKKKSPLDQEIERLHDELLGLGIADTDREKILDQLTKLYKMKNDTSSDHAHFKDWIPVIGSLAGVGVIMVFELKGHTFTTGGKNFLMKPRG